MAESNGLLDFVNSPAAMGLLAAGFGGLAGANRNTPYNNLGRAGLAGLAGYSAADALGQKRKLMEDAAARKAAIPGLFSTGADGKTTFDYKGAAAIDISPTDIKGYMELPNAGRPKVARTVEVPGINGGMTKVQLDDYGQQVGEGIQGYVAPQLVDTGDSKRFVTPNAGQSFQVGVSPYQQQSLAVRQEGNNILREGVDVQKQAQRTQVITMPDGSIQLIDKGTGQAVQPQTPDGKPLAKAPAPVKLTEGEGKASIYLSQMQDASRALRALPDVSPVKVGATGSTWTNWMAPADAQKAAQAQRQWAEAFLRAKTGAAATQPEVEGNIRTFFPVVGDTPEVIESKSASRAQAEQDMHIPAGRGAAQIKPVGAQSQQDGMKQPPQVGAVAKGHRFKGGNPADPANWEAQ